MSLMEKICMRAIRKGRGEGRSSSNGNSNDGDNDLTGMNNISYYLTVI